MERLTGYNSFGGVYGIGMRSGDNTETINKILKRLAEYENTGLPPEKIEHMKARLPLNIWLTESPEKMSIFGVPVSKIMELAEEEKHSIRDLNGIANSVEEKMMYMCGCRNCIEKVKMIIKGEVKPIENQCKYCKIECDARSTENKLLRGNKNENGCK